MTDTDTSSSPTPKKAKKPKMSAHPKVSNMVLAAIGNLKERGGSSLQAIKKYVSATYKVDADKLAPFVKKYLRNAVSDGTLIQTKGKGATGSFKLSAGKQAVGGGGERKVGRPPKKAGEQKKPEKNKSIEKKKVTGKPKKVKEGKKEKKTKVSKKPKAPKPKKATAKKNSPKKK